MIGEQGRANFAKLMRLLGIAKTPAPKVLLVMYNGELKICSARKTQSGYLARWIDSDNQWSLLKPDGTVEGTTLVKGWKPYSNCEMILSKEKDIYER